MVQKLLESGNPKMEVGQCFYSDAILWLFQQLATNSFTTFSNIEENSPSYNRQYDFFISKFSQMCHGPYGEESRPMRRAGLKGLTGAFIIGV